PCAQSLVMLPYHKNAGAAAAMSGGGQMIVSSIVSMGLVKLGLGEAWHLSIVITVFTLITLFNIFRGFGTQEARESQLS
ncbi:MFS transporter, partial [Vibrio sp. 10N.222.55.E8]